MTEAARTYETMLPYISSVPATIASTPEHHAWTENLLARFCMLSSRHVTANTGNHDKLLSSSSYIHPASILTPFRAYANHRNAKSNLGTTPLSSTGSKSSMHLRIWQAYYNALSVLVQGRIIQPMFKSRFHQRNELNRVQAAYETALLADTTFPKANESSSQIETWVEQVMANWRIMGGSTWQDSDLGEGGKAALGRTVLDVGHLLDTKIDLSNHGGASRCCLLTDSTIGALQSSD